MSVVRSETCGKESGVPLPRLDGRQRVVFAKEVAQVSVAVGGCAEGFALKLHRAQREDGAAQVAVAVAAVVERVGVELVGGPYDAGQPPCRTEQG